MERSVSCVLNCHQSYILRRHFCAYRNLSASIKNMSLLDSFAHFVASLSLFLSVFGLFLQTPGSDSIRVCANSRHRFHRFSFRQKCTSSAANQTHGTRYTSTLLIKVFSTSLFFFFGAFFSVVSARWKLWNSMRETCFLYLAPFFSRHADGYCGWCSKEEFFKRNKKKTKKT